MPDVFEDLKQRLNDFANERDWDQFHSPKNLVMALIVEAAELVEQFQWLSQEESRAITPEKKVEVEAELADILIYLVRIADKLEVDLYQAALSKLEKNSHKYPVEKVRGKSAKYTEY